MTSQLLPGIPQVIYRVLYYCYYRSELQALRPPLYKHQHLDLFIKAFTGERICFNVVQEEIHRPVQ